MELSGRDPGAAVIKKHERGECSSRMRGALGAAQQSVPENRKVSQGSGELTCPALNCIEDPQYSTILVRVADAETGEVFKFLKICLRNRKALIVCF